MKIKSHFEDVDQLIAKVKAVTIKSKTRQAKLSAVGYPPQPVTTKWGCWLRSESNCGKYCRFWNFGNSSKGQLAKK